MSFKALLWKDYRQNRRVLCAVGIFLAVPFVVGLVIGALDRLRPPSEYGYVEQIAWSDMFYAAGMWSFALLVLACPFVGGNAVAGERADRSAEFAAYLPVSRRSAITSKAVLAVGVCLLVAVVDLAVAYIAGTLKESWSTSYAQQMPGWIMVGVTTAALIFGVSWLLSAILNSPAIAAACGILAALLLAGTLAFLDFIRGTDEPVILAEWWLPISSLLGVGCFVAGVVYYLRRVEP